MFIIFDFQEFTFNDDSDFIADKELKYRIILTASISQVKAMHKKVIEALVITGCARGSKVIIKRITLIQTDYPFKFNK
ncbi:ATP-dependent DNA helicase PIF1-like [Aphis craccivora]|uniref:ATP-dependent DNA helicase PIF1-like n=1 Tax=Aphis craccivora TaxID=307492 RepID=A0A6G0Z2Q5_APHCR|nr:ATP-dependent DNA helicase PIF1-like [Aphis craccivora]